MTFHFSLWKPFLLALSLLFTLYLSTTPVARAATITVCASGCAHTTIAAAIDAAALTGDIIDVTDATHTEAGITVDNKNLTIQGQGANNTIVQANAMSNTALTRVFTVTATATVTITNMTIRHGYAASGGGILNSGNLTLNKVWLTKNATNNQDGGGIFSNGPLTIIDSTISNNTAVDDAGGIRTNSTTIINNSTISGNTAGTGDGGGLQTRGTVTINNSTITNNTTTTGRGGGVHSENSGLISYRYTIIAGNSAGAAGTDDCGGNATTSADYNLLGDGGGCTSDQTNDITTTDPQLDPLVNNGGPTPTHKPQTGSPAIDTGQATCIDTGGNTITKDQREQNRPSDGNSDNSIFCDIGAYELQAPLAVTLASFTAEETNNYVNLAWETTIETNNLGFYLYRNTSDSQPDTPINKELVPSTAPGSGQGSSYDWHDTDAVTGETYFYWLASVDIYGNEGVYGPISIILSPPTAVTLGNFESQPASSGYFLILVGILSITMALIRQRVKQ